MRPACTPSVSPSSPPLAVHLSLPSPPLAVNTCPHTRPHPPRENAKMRAHIAKEFDRADLNNDELISIDEFYMYFYSTLCFKFPVV
eukprot:363516-Chlamydomonas_euryale.AAC.1